MASDIVNTLFGPATYDIAAQQRADLNKQAYDFARLDPMQRAAMMMYKAGGMLGNAAGSALGMEDPRIAATKQAEAAAQGIDLTDPQALLERAAAISDPRLKMRLQLLAQQQQTQQQAAEAAKTKMALDLANAQKALRPEDKRTNEQKNAEAIATAQGLTPGSEDWNKAVKLNLDHMLRNPNLEVREQGVAGKPGFTQLVVVDKVNNTVAPIGEPKSSAAATKIILGGGEGVTNDLSSDAIDFMARRALSGDTSVISGLARSKGARAKVENRMAELAPLLGVTPEELSMRTAEFQGVKSAQRAAGTQEAKVKLAASEAYKMIDVVRAAIPAVNPSQYPTLNALKNAIDKQQGGPAVSALYASLNALINTYARAINPNGVATVSDKDHARQMINEAMSSGQLDAVLRTMDTEMKAALASSGESRNAMRAERNLSPNARTSASPTRQTAPSSVVDLIPGAAPPAGGVEEWVRGPDGKLMRK